MTPGMCMHSSPAVPARHESSVHTRQHRPVRGPANCCSWMFAAVMCTGTLASKAVAYGKRSGAFMLGWSEFLRVRGGIFFAGCQRRAVEVVVEEAVVVGGGGVGGYYVGWRWSAARGGWMGMAGFCMFQAGGDGGPRTMLYVFSQA